MNSGLMRAQAAAMLAAVEATKPVDKSLPLPVAVPDALPTDLKPGIYVGKDGHRYRIFSDGKTYREEYLEVRRRDKAGEIHVTRKGPSLRYVGNSRLKA